MIYYTFDLLPVAAYTNLGSRPGAGALGKPKLMGGRYSKTSTHPLYSCGLSDDKPVDPLPGSAYNPPLVFCTQQKIYYNLVNSLLLLKKMK